MANYREERRLAKVKETVEYRMKHTSKLCTGCMKEQSIYNFTTCTYGGMRRLISWCRACVKERGQDKELWDKCRKGVVYDSNGNELILVTRGSHSQYLRKPKRAPYRKADRTNPEDWYIFLHRSMKSADKRRKHFFNLTEDEVKELVTDKKCVYCDKKYSRMSLDRIDNSLGHEKKNVVVCCGFCNLTRQDMPIGTWLAMVPALKEKIWSGELDEFIKRKGKLCKDGPIND